MGKKSRKREYLPGTAHVFMINDISCVPKQEQADTGENEKEY